MSRNHKRGNYYADDTDVDEEDDEDDDGRQFHQPHRGAPNAGDDGDGDGVKENIDYDQQQYRTQNQPQQPQSTRHRQSFRIGSGSTAGTTTGYCKRNRIRDVNSAGVSELELFTNLPSAARNCAEQAYEIRHPMTPGAGTTRRRYRYPYR